MWIFGGTWGRWTGALRSPREGCLALGKVLPLDIPISTCPETGGRSLPNVAVDPGAKGGKPVGLNPENLGKKVPPSGLFCDWGSLVMPSVISSEDVVEFSAGDEILVGPSFDVIYIWLNKLLVFLAFSACIYASINSRTNSKTFWLSKNTFKIHFFVIFKIMQFFYFY